MRAAVVAVRAGLFDGFTDADAVRLDPARSSAVVGHTGEPALGSLPWTRTDVGGPIVLILWGHAGAGASTVALAVAEGLAENTPVQLVDNAEPERSGLSSASIIELGVDRAGWRRGRRGRVDVFRRAETAATADFSAPWNTDDAEQVSVIDAGWSLTTALSPVPQSLVHSARCVVVTRVTVPAVRQTECLLEALQGQVAVAAMGPARWPRIVEAHCGPRLRELRSQARAVRIPVDRRLEVAGVTGDRLPNSISAAGRLLATMIFPAEESSPRSRRPVSRHSASRARKSR